jgi:hypothetical protein
MATMVNICVTELTGLLATSLQHDAVGALVDNGEDFVFVHVNKYICQRSRRDDYDYGLQTE